MIKNYPLLLLQYFVLSLIICFSALTLQAEPVQTVITNGDSANRVDIAIVGDGYTSAEIDQYQADVQTFIQKVFEEQPLSEYKRYFNVHRIDVISNQSGADHPERTSPLFVDTAFDGTYNCANIVRLICVNTSKVNQVMSRSLPASGYDIKLVLINDREYGGSGGAVAVASKHFQAVELILHEIGHSFGLLADEYDYGPPSCSVNAGVEPNVTRETARDLIKWKSWIAPTTPIPTATTAPAVPGIYQGAKYCQNGLYRPTYNSKMRQLGLPYEQINAEQFVKRIYNYVSPIDQATPSVEQITIAANQLQTFSIHTPQPTSNNLEITWLLNGVQQSTGGSNSQNTWTVSSALLSPGNYEIKAVVKDRTAFVRNDPNKLLEATKSWLLTVRAGQSSARIRIMSPHHITATLTGGTKTILVAAEDASSTIQKVEFYANEVRIGEDTTAPYKFVWSGIPGGRNVVVARMINALNTTTISKPIYIIGVSLSPKLPFNMDDVP